MDFFRMVEGALVNITVATLRLSSHKTLDDKIQAHKIKSNVWTERNNNNK